MKILIIGGMGVIGGAITEAAAKDHDVWVLSRRKPFDKWEKLQVRYLQGDWKDDLFAEKLVSKEFDVIVDTQIFDEKQLKRSADIVNGHCKQFIYISTDSVYPHPGKDVVEDENINIYDIKWKYGYDKLKGELFLKKHSNEYDFSWTVIRPTITFGDTRIPVGFSAKRNTFTLADRILNNRPIIRFDDPKTRHALCHVSIFGEAVVCLFLNKSAYSQSYHISDDMAYTYDEIFECIEKSLGKKGIYIHVSSKVIKKISESIYEEMIYDKDPEFTLDNRKIKDLCPDKDFKVDLKMVIAETLINLENKKTVIEQDNEYDMISDLILLNESKRIDNREIVKYVNSLPKDYVKKLRDYGIRCRIRYLICGIKKILRPIKHLIIQKKI